jgi:hypothetical protein
MSVRHAPCELWEFLGVPAGANDPRFQTIADRRARQTEMEEYLRPHLQRFTMEELFHGLQPNRSVTPTAEEIARRSVDEVTGRTPPQKRQS